MLLLHPAHPLVTVPSCGVLIIDFKSPFLLGCAPFQSRGAGVFFPFLNLCRSSPSPFIYHLPDRKSSFKDWHIKDPERTEKRKQKGQLRALPKVTRQFSIRVLTLSARCSALNEAVIARISSSTKSDT